MKQLQVIESESDPKCIFQRGLKFAEFIDFSQICIFPKSGQNGIFQIFGPVARKRRRIPSRYIGSCRSRQALHWR